MKLNQKRLLKIVIGSFVLTAIIKFLTVASIWGIYSCPSNPGNCGALNHAQTKVTIGSILQIISYSIFLLSLITYIWFKVRKKP